MPCRIYYRENMSRFIVQH